MRRLLLLVLLLSAHSSLEASQKEEILWVKWTLVPEYIQSGKFKDQGYLDHFLRYVQQQLPEYQHKSEFQTLNRISLSWQKGNVCSLHLWLGYWPEKIVYSNPYAFTPRFGIVTKKTSALAKQFQDQESISLQYLLEHTPYRLGMLPLYYEGSKDSRYPLLAPLIEPHVGTNKVNEFINNKNEVSVVYLEKGRVDYIIRQRITQFAELKNSEKQDNYKFYFLDEGRRHKLVASACSNTEFGKKVIGKINALIDKGFHLQYLKYRRQWDDENPTFDNTFIDYFINKKPIAYVTE